LLTGKLDRIFAVTDELIFRVRSPTYFDDSILTLNVFCVFVAQTL